jgi:hypothetical protein
MLNLDMRSHSAASSKNLSAGIIGCTFAMRVKRAEPGFESGKPNVGYPTMHGREPWFRSADRIRRSTLSRAESHPAINSAYEPCLGARASRAQGVPKSRCAFSAAVCIYALQSHAKRTGTSQIGMPQAAKKITDRGNSDGR